MIEEMYVIDGNVKHRLDLDSPSGITLNFKSCLFDDLSKISASYSYTFKLPMTVNNRRVLDLAEDIRHNSTMIRRRLKALFIQNGITLFENANLYIDSTSKNHYQCVLTWGVISGFEGLRDNDVSLRNLTGGNSTMYNADTTPTALNDYNNSAQIVRPMRMVAKTTKKSDGFVPYATVQRSDLPAMPVKYIVDRINAKYSTHFFFAEGYVSYAKWNASEGRFDYLNLPLFDLGVVPFVNGWLTSEQLSQRAGKLSFVRSSCIRKSILAETNIQTEYGSYYHANLPEWKIGDVDIDYTLLGVKVNQNAGHSYFDIARIARNDASGFGAKLGERAQLTKLRIEGKISLFIKGSGQAKLAIFAPDAEWGYKLVAEIEGENDITQKITYENQYGVQTVATLTNFFFTAEEGTEPIDLDDFRTADVSPIYFAVPFGDFEIQTFNVTLTPLGEELITDDFQKGYDMATWKNMPDVSCLTFLKGLYYMLGAFPNVDKSGNIVPVLFSKLKENIENGVVADWSDKIFDDVFACPESVKYNVGSLSQHNYYLMKNDDLDTSKDEEETDVYDAGKGCITVINETLSANKTIIQLPWYGAYILDRTNPNRLTGDDVKQEKREDGKYVFCESKPAIGIIAPVPIGRENWGANHDQSTYIGWEPTGQYAMAFKVFDGFKNLSDNPNYEYLQQIVSKPYLIIEYLNLNEFDLRDIDYSVPVYLSKYNSYFAVSSITRSGNGKCKCELIKLP